MLEMKVLLPQSSSTALGCSGQWLLRPHATGCSGPISPQDVQHATGHPHQIHTGPNVDLFSFRAYVSPLTAPWRSFH